MATIRLASVLKIDEQGYAHGLASVVETTKTVNSSSGDKRTIMLDNREVDCFELIVECKNTKGESMPIKTAIFGMTINPEPVETKRIGSKNIPIYNKFTTVLLRLNVLTKEELEKARKDITVLDTDTITALFLAIKNLPVKFKPQKNAKGFTEPNLLTLEVTGDMANDS